MLAAIQECFDGTGIEVKLGMQSNATLFSKEVGDALLEYGMSVGVSLDGPPEFNDRVRYDHQERGSSANVEAALQILAAPPYKSLFSGFLCVVDLRADPCAILEYFARFSPRTVDFLLPYDNWDNRPLGKANAKATPYGEWLITAFDHWNARHPSIRVREFENIVRTLTGHASQVESIGLQPVDLIVIETNGDIEAVDSLKASYDGATELKLNVESDNFNTALLHVAVASRQSGADGLCSTCRDCSMLEFCGGGYLPNRYSSANGFKNPSIYCADLKLLIGHVHDKLYEELETAGLAGIVQ